MFPIIDHLLEKYADLLDSKSILVQYDAISEGISALREQLAAGLWLVAVDENTWRVAGASLAQYLDAEGLTWQRYDVPKNDDESYPKCDDARVDAFQSALEASGATAAIAVGSGTINDIVKLASFRQGLDMAVVATAPSMNGYTSGIAAVLSKGVKTTIPCKAPKVVISDLDIMAEAPERMIQSGLGDLISKPVSNSDWQLSAILNGTPHSKNAMEIIEAGAAMLDGVAPKLPQRDREAVGGLSASLMLSGLAMSVAGSSSPASGGEHLISHYIDMTAFEYDLPYDFHGCQVGVGTLTTAYIYEKLRALDPSTIDIDALVEAHVDWETYQGVLQERFKNLYNAVVKHTEKSYPTPERLRERLTDLVAQWDDIMVAVKQTLRTQGSIEAELLEAECPVRFSDLGVSRSRALEAVTWSKDIRNRYTILHLAAELGYLDAWAEEALELLFQN